jgi:hypothetical protein
MRTTRALAFATLALALSAACNVEDPDDDAQVGSDTTGAQECTPGSEGCACVEGQCLGELQCFSNLCVVGPAASDSGDESEDESNDEADESESSGTPEVTATEGSTSAPGESSSDDGTPEESTGAEESSSEGEESSTTEPAPECLEMDNYCANGMFQTCVGGQWDETTCSEVCGATGYLSPGCASADACQCEGFADAACDAGAWTTCYCYDVLGYDICDEELLGLAYDACYSGGYNTEITCLGMYPWDEGPDCNMIFDICNF